MVHRRGMKGGHRLKWCARLIVLGAIPALLAGASCSQNPPVASVPGAEKAASVVVGRSSRTDVFAALGRPGRTESSPNGETWVYESKDGDSGGRTYMDGASSVMGVAGAFVPYLGLAGSSLGLARTAAGAARREPDAASLTVNFGGDGIVRDCVYSSTALPTGLTGSAQGSANVGGCRKPSIAPGASP